MAVLGILAAAVPLGLAVAKVRGGASEDPPARSRAHSFDVEDCIAAWNAPTNADRRRALAAASTRWVVEVSRWQVDHPAGDLRGTACSFFFRTETRWRSVGFAWQHDGEPRWGIPPRASGRISPEQTLQPPNALVGDDGALVAVESCGEVEYDLEGARPGGAAAVECFLDALADRAPASLAVRLLTVEGDPVSEYLYVLRDGSVEKLVDTTQDRFGVRRWHHFCCSGARELRGSIAAVGCEEMTRWPRG